MKDSDFKKLPHVIYPHKIGSCGSAVHKGYKPDVTVVNANDELLFILESEQKTDRKAFLGDLLKAQKYAEECGASPALIIVMRPQANTKEQQIADHIQPYLSWLNQSLKAGVSLSMVAVISDTQYQKSIEAKEPLGSEAFMRRGIILKI